MRAAMTLPAATLFLDIMLAVGSTARAESPLAIIDPVVIPSRYAINDVEVINGFAYVADTYVVRAIDIRDLSRPRETYSSRRIPYARSIRRVGADLLLVETDQAGVRGFEELRIIRPGVLAHRRRRMAHPAAVQAGADTSVLYVGIGRRIAVIDAVSRSEVGSLTLPGLAASPGEIVRLLADRSGLWAVVGRRVPDGTWPGSSEVFYQRRYTVVPVDISDPRGPRAMPEMRFVLDTDCTGHLGAVGPGEIHAGRAYTAAGMHVLSFDLHNGTVSSHAHGMPHNVQVARAGRVLLVGTDRTVLIHDLEGPSPLRPLATFTTREAPRAARFDGRYLFAAGHQYGGLRIVDLRGVVPVVPGAGPVLHDGAAGRAMLPR